MASNSTAYLIPSGLAFLVFIAHFYAHENAVSKASPSFLLALLMVALLLSYLILNITDSLFAYASLSYGVFGLLCLGLAVIMFRS
jgi:hypothetical protein